MSEFSIKFYSVPTKLAKSKIENQNSKLNHLQFDHLKQTEYEHPPAKQMNKIANSSNVSIKLEYQPSLNLCYLTATCDEYGTVTSKTISLLRSIKLIV